MQGQVISLPLLSALRAIEPSRDRALLYYPCRAKLRFGAVVEHLYLVEATEFVRNWGDIDRPTVAIDDVVCVEESPDRLPPRIADAIYAAGESGMGYCVFTLEFSDGSSQAYVTGNAVDFVPMPDRKNGADIVRVRPHHGREREHLQSLLYSWCPFRYPDEGS